MDYRNLTDLEINGLKLQGCIADNWSSLLVSNSFTIDHIHHTRFAGKVKLGKLQGLYASYLKNCDIGDEVYINRVNHLEDYKVENNVVIENVSSLQVVGETSFGNGSEVEVLNEGGGRELLLYDQLTAQIAYLMVHYRDEKEMIDHLEKLIRNYAKNKTSTRGNIKSGSHIQSVQTIRNVNFGPATKISGAQLLQDGTVVSCIEDPTRIGHGVIAKNFIIQSGSCVDTGAMLDRCFVGQGVQLGKQFSAENSVFFANCEGFHGEAVSLFAGPYTVTHHKSTLLIAGLLSFFNAGSGTNQSNHMYKLGPIHQGIVERGCKTGSFAYLLWPSRVGAFTVVMDKHSANFDSSDFPFSYLTVEDGRSMLTPAMNLLTVGTRRDSDKWPNRDRRKDPDKLDLIHFELFNPYVIAKILRGSAILQTLYENTPKKQKYVKYRGVSMLRLLLKTCRKYYQLALKKYFGEQLLNKLEKGNFHNLSELHNYLRPEKSNADDWIDMAGLLAPREPVQSIIDDLKIQKISELAQLRKRFEEVYNNYDAYAWSWYAATLANETGIKLDQITTAELLDLVSQWKVNAQKLNNMILKDAEKEFDQNSRIGFGIDGNEEAKSDDFSAVRGTYEGNNFVLKLREENEEIETKANHWIALFEKDLVSSPPSVPSI